MNTGGLSKTLLAHMHYVMAGYVERGEVPGLVTLVSRRGEVHVDAIGSLSISDSTPMRLDSPQATERLPRFLDFGLSSHQRLISNRSHFQIFRPSA